MKRRSLGISLRYKLLALLTVLPMVTLSLYLFMATGEFERDKMAYVFDASVAVARSLGTQLRATSESVLARVKPIIEGYDEATGEFTPVVSEIFQRETDLNAIVLFRGAADGSYQKLGQLTKPSGKGSEFVTDDRRLEELRQRAREDRFFMEALSADSQDLVLVSRSGELEADRHVVFMVLVGADALVQAFRRNVLYSSFMLDKKGRVLLGVTDLGGTVVENENFETFFGGVLSAERPEGTEEIRGATGDTAIVAFYKTGIGETRVVSVVDRKAALKAVQNLLTKSILFFVALLSATVLLSVFASTRLTSALRDLYEATKKIASGDFDVRVESKSKDEVGGLAEGFNLMAGEVSRLMKETAEKARLQSELETVKTVQETLFPHSSMELGSYKIVGHFEPASECGGDWWNYSKVGNRILIWIGDATGHGAPAALITSAARSAASIIDILPEMGPGEALRVLNHAIHETSRGRIMMTFFLGVIDLDKNELSYASASHDPPYIIRRKSEKPLSKKDLIPLMEEVGPRLGEKPKSEYKEAKIQLLPGDIIFGYTDGIIDIKNPSGETLGERNFLKSLIKSAQVEGDVELKLNGLRGDLEGFRQGATLIDDVTMVMCHYKGAA